MLEHAEWIENDYGKFDRNIENTFQDEKLPLAFMAKRHQEPIEGVTYEARSWCIRGWFYLSSLHITNITNAIYFRRKQ